jgi:hypothetical protein
LSLTVSLLTKCVSTKGSDPFKGEGKEDPIFVPKPDVEGHILDVDDTTVPAPKTTQVHSINNFCTRKIVETAIT